ncbi:MAG: HRDC domain-containing protein [Anaerolineae bacterium]|nr:HRDC domain-containing protein [Anaerolineae bacterium]
MTSLPPAAYIDSDAKLRALIPHFSTEPFLALDTESNSLYAYREQVCLFQVTTRKGDYLIDPFGIADMSPLGRVLANPRIEKIFHAAEYDIMGIKRDYGFQVVNVFDTMIAARIAGHAQVGLNTLLQEQLGVQLDKRHQRDNWGKRPLDGDSLLYAQMDSHFLPMLRNDLYDELKLQGRFDEVRDAFAELAFIDPPILEFDPDGYWHIGRPMGLRGRQLAILRELYLLRERLAEERDLPPFKVLTNDRLVEIAQHAPSHKASLAEVPRLSPGFIRRYGDSVLEAVANGQQAHLPRPPRQPRLANTRVLNRYTALREWRKQRASARGVDSDLIVSKNVLWSLAHQAPRTLDDLSGIPGLGPWRLSHYGPELLEVLEKVR